MDGTAKRWPGMARRGYWRVLQWLVGLAVIFFAGRTLVRNWGQLQSQHLVWNVRPEYLALSIAAVWAMYALLIMAWRVLLLSWGQRLGAGTAARIWSLSSLGKYLPGKVWTIAGMAVMAQRAGVAAWAATGSSIILQALAIGMGAAVVGITGPDVLEAQHPGTKAVLVLLVVGSLIGVLLLLWPPFVRRLLRLVSAEAAEHGTPGGGAIALGIAINLVAWVGYGAAFVLLARGLLPDVHLPLRMAVGAFTASYLAGFLALFAPGGLGVREGIFVLMLQGPIGIAAATALALASRILLTFTEFGAAALLVLFTRETSRDTSSS